MKIGGIYKYKERTPRKCIYIRITDITCGYWSYKILSSVKDEVGDSWYTGQTKSEWAGTPGSWEEFHSFTCITCDIENQCHRMEVLCIGCRKEP